MSDSEEQVPIRREHQKYVEKILGSKPFQRAGKQEGIQRQESRVHELFAYLCAQTIEGNHSLDAEAIARELYSNEGKSGQVASETARAKDALREYYSAEGKDDPVVLAFVLRKHLVAFSVRPGSIPSPTITVASPDFNPWPYDREGDHGISIDRFRDFLISMCDVQGFSKTERDEGAVKFVQKTVHFSGLRLVKNNEFQSFFDRLKESNDHLVYSEMRRIMDDLDVHPIMLDPLLSEPAPKSTNCIVIQMPFMPLSDSCLSEGSVNTEFKKTGEREEKSYGKAARYAIPEKRLAKTEASFVYLILDGATAGDKEGGSSDRHHHPGDEFLLVLKGKVRVRLHDTGSEVDLAAESYVHFYSEQTHSAHNVGNGDAHVLIIRFYQTGEGSKRDDHRQAIRRQLWQALSKRTPDMRAFDDVAWQWILEASAGRSVPRYHDIPGEIMNRLGLARLLARVPRSDLRSKRILKAIRKPDRAQYGSVRAILWDVCTGRLRLHGDEIPNLAQKFGVFHLLFWEFLVPGVTHQVSVRRDEDHDDWINMERIFDRFNLPKPGAGVSYEIPSRALACSDIAITRLRLAKGLRCPPNQHPGTELLLPLRGQVTVKFGHDEADAKALCRLCAGSQMAHYSSEKKHFVVNDAEEEAEMLVIRIYGEGSDRTKGHNSAEAPRKRKSR